MATTTLRAYLDEVRVLLDQEALEEVIGHCRHILQHFPKNLDAYRLLGQALLEKNRPQEAIDVFHRVLGSIPDDFTAHLGLSAAYEEQDNYASAIFHMERGFEQAPNNAPLQAELKRLYGRANRPIPVRIPMTRGALARIYFKGKLYEQAINEIQQGLEQTPDRIDLLVIYALALWRSEHHDEAADIAMTVLESLPDALEANRIMASIWLANRRPTDARPFLNKLEQLDPFVAWQAIHGDNTQPPTEAFRVTRLDWNVRAAAALSNTASDWVSTMGEVFDNPQSVELGSNRQVDWFGDFSDLAEEKPNKPKIDGLKPPPKTPSGNTSLLQRAKQTGALRASSLDTSLSQDDVPDWFKDFAPEFTNLSQKRQTATVPVWLSDDSTPDMVLPPPDLLDAELTDAPAKPIRKLESSSNAQPEPTATATPTAADSATVDQPRDGLTEANFDWDNFGQPNSSESESSWGTPTATESTHFESMFTESQVESPELDNIPDWLQSGASPQQGNAVADAAQDLDPISSIDWDAASPPQETNLPLTNFFEQFKADAESAAADAVVSEQPNRPAASSNRTDQAELPADFQFDFESDRESDLNIGEFDLTPPPAEPVVAALPQVTAAPELTPAGDDGFEWMLNDDLLDPNADRGEPFGGEPYVNTDLAASLPAASVEPASVMPASNVADSTNDFPNDFDWMFSDDAPVASPKPSLVAVDSAPELDLNLDWLTTDALQADLPAPPSAPPMAALPSAPPAEAGLTLPSKPGGLRDRLIKQPPAENSVANPPISEMNVPPVAPTAPEIPAAKRTTGNQAVTPEASASAIDWLAAPPTPDPEVGFEWLKQADSEPENNFQSLFAEPPRYEFTPESQSSADPTDLDWLLGDDAGSDQNAVPAASFSTGPVSVAPATPANVEAWLAPDDAPPASVTTTWHELDEAEDFARLFDDAPDEGVSFSAPQQSVNTIPAPANPLMDSGVEHKSDPMGWMAAYGLSPTDGAPDAMSMFDEDEGNLETIPADPLAWMKHAGIEPPQDSSLTAEVAPQGVDQMSDLGLEALLAVDTPDDNAAANFDVAGIALDAWADQPGQGAPSETATPHSSVGDTLMDSKPRLSGLLRSRIPLNPQAPPPATESADPDWLKDFGLLPTAEESSDHISAIDELDWLTAIGSTSSGSDAPPAQEPSFPAATSIPVDPPLDLVEPSMGLATSAELDWLSGFADEGSAGSALSIEAETVESVAPQGAVPLTSIDNDDNDDNWLADLSLDFTGSDPRGSAPVATIATEQVDEAGDSGAALDWLTGFTTDTTDTTQEAVADSFSNPVIESVAPQAASPSTIEVDDSLDWLTGIVAPQTGTTSPTTELTPEVDETPTPSQLLATQLSGENWLDSFTAETPQQVDAPSDSLKLDYLDLFANDSSDVETSTSGSALSAVTPDVPTAIPNDFSDLFASDDGPTETSAPPPPAKPTTSGRLSSRPRQADRKAFWNAALNDATQEDYSVTPVTDPLPAATDVPEAAEMDWLYGIAPSKPALDMSLGALGDPVVEPDQPASIAPISPSIKTSELDQQMIAKMEQAARVLKRESQLATQAPEFSTPAPVPNEPVVEAEIPPWLSSLQPATDAQGVVSQHPTVPLDQIDFSALADNSEDFTADSSAGIAKFFFEDSNATPPAVAELVSSPTVDKPLEAGLDFLKDVLSEPVTPVAPRKGTTMFDDTFLEREAQADRSAVTDQAKNMDVGKDDDADWLAVMHLDQAAPPSPVATSTSQAVTTEDEDWFAAMDIPAGVDGQTVAPAEATQEDADWFAAMGVPVQTESVPMVGIDEDQSDWFNSFTEAAGLADVTNAPAPENPNTALPAAWLDADPANPSTSSDVRRLIAARQRAETPPPIEVDAPDWLRESDDLIVPLEATTDAADAPAPSTGQTDKLLSSSALLRAAASANVIDPSLTPDWLTGLDETTTNAPPMDELEPPVQGASRSVAELDWVDQVDVGSATPTNVEPPEPDWLTEIKRTSSTSLPVQPPPAEPSGRDRMSFDKPPAWKRKRDTEALSLGNDVPTFSAPPPAKPLTGLAGRLNPRAEEPKRDDLPKQADSSTTKPIAPSASGAKSPVKDDDDLSDLINNILGGSTPDDWMR